MVFALLFFTCIVSMQMAIAENLPVVTVEPQQITVLEGQQLTVKCKIDEPILRCHWINLETRILKPTDFVENSTECNIHIHVSDDFDGLLQCGILPVVGAGKRKVYGNISITIAKTPKLVQINVTGMNPVNSTFPPDTFEENETILADCRIIFGRPEARITWFIGTEPIEDGITIVEDIGPEGRGWKTTSQNFTRTLTFLDHGKELRCIAEHLALTQGILSHQLYRLNVHFKPKPGVIEQHAFKVGHPGKIVATIHAIPKPNITWLVGEDEILEGSTTGRFHAANLTARNKTTWEAALHIDTVLRQDGSKDFKLTAKNLLGEEEYTTRILLCSRPVVSASVTAWSMAILIAFFSTMFFIILIKSYCEELAIKPAKPFHETKSDEDAKDDQTEKTM